jgi:hypothetical protein
MQQTRHQNKHLPLAVLRDSNFPLKESMVPVILMMVSEAWYSSHLA